MQFSRHNAKPAGPEHQKRERQNYILAGQIKLLEAWKSVHIANYPFRMEYNNVNQIQTSRTLRPSSIKLWKDNAKTKAGQNSFSVDTAKLWNNCPDVIKTACSIGIAKKEIKHYCKSLEL